MIYVLIVAAAMVAVGTVLLTVRRPAKGDEVERFHRARQMTTEWSRRYAATGHLDVPRPSPAEDDVPDAAAVNGAVAGSAPAGQRR